MLSRLLLAFVLIGVSACQRSAVKPGPLGKLPDATTTAEPLWLPFTVRIGAPSSAHPAERRFADLREVTSESDGSIQHVAWAPNARQIVFERGASACPSVGLLDLVRGTKEPILASAVLPEFTSDGARVLIGTVECTSTKPGAAGLPVTWLSAEIDGSSPQTIFRRTQRTSQVVPHATGTTFALEALSPPKLTRADGAGVTTPMDFPELGPADGSLVSFAVSPDATMVAYVLAKGDNRSLEVASLGDASIRRRRVILPTAKILRDPSFAPDGRSLLFAADLDGPESALYLASVVGGEEGKVVERLSFAGDGAACPRFSSDKKFLAFTSNRHNRATETRHLYIARWVEDP